jgi:uncharacterized membrane protein YphA (DoxX/SURF4 family)
MTGQKKYWCPTHPEVESDDPNAICKKCGTMILIPREPEIATNKKVGGHTFKDFLPLISMIAIVVILTGVFSFIRTPATWMVLMRQFMAAFFLVFGGLKLLKLKDFAIAYKEYDLIAMRSNFYAHLYPFIEIGFGVLLLFNFVPMLTNWATFIIMSISALGVYLKLGKGEEVPCACLGMVFKVPMTWVTLIEDLLMAAMALVMIII